MDHTKKVDLLRKRNAQMQEELDKLKELNKNHKSNTNGKRVSDLITELEDIRKDWLNVLEELNREREEYAELIKDLKMIRETFKGI